MAYKVNHLHLKALDPRKTAQWYVDNFGAKIVSESQTPDGQLAVRMDLHGVPFNVTPIIGTQNKERQSLGLEHITVDTDDFVTDVARMRASGVKVLEEGKTSDGRNICFFEGPEGVQIEFMEIKWQTFRQASVSASSCTAAATCPRAFTVMSGVTSTGARRSSKVSIQMVFIPTRFAPSTSFNRWSPI